MKLVCLILFTCCISLAQNRYPFYTPVATGEAPIVYTTIDDSIREDRRDAYSRDAVEKMDDNFLFIGRPLNDPDEWTMYDDEFAVEFPLNIASTALIDTVIITLYQSSCADAGSEIRIYGYADTATFFANAHAHDISAHQGLTTAYVDWNPPDAGVTNSSNPTPNLASILTEIIGGANWSANKNAGFVFTQKVAWNDEEQFVFDDKHVIAYTPKIHVVHH